MLYKEPFDENINESWACFLKTSLISYILSSLEDKISPLHLKLCNYQINTIMKKEVKENEEDSTWCL